MKTSPMQPSPAYTPYTYTPSRPNMARRAIPAGAVAVAVGLLAIGGSRSDAPGLPLGSERATPSPAPVVQALASQKESAERARKQRLETVDWSTPQSILEGSLTPLVVGKGDSPTSMANNNVNPAALNSTTELRSNLITALKGQQPDGYQQRDIVFIPTPFAREDGPNVMVEPVEPTPAGQLEPK